MSVRLGRFIERVVCFQPPSLLIGNVWVPVMPLLCMPHTLQSALESGQEARIVHIDFSAAFHWVSHLDIHYKLCSVGTGGSVLSILTVSIKQITVRYGLWLSE